VFNRKSKEQILFLFFHHHRQRTAVAQSKVSGVRSLISNSEFGNDGRAVHLCNPLVAPKLDAGGCLKIVLDKIWRQVDSANQSEKPSIQKCLLNSNGERTEAVQI
jgi:hypothetical protein